MLDTLAPPVLDDEQMHDLAETMARGFGKTDLTWWLYVNPDAATLVDDVLLELGIPSPDVTEAGEPVAGSVILKILRLALTEQFVRQLIAEGAGESEVF